MSKEKRKLDPVVILLDLIIIVMFFVMIMAVIDLSFYISLEKKSGNFMQDATEMSFDLKNNNYASLIQGAYINDFNKHKDTAQFDELAEYTEAAFMYKVYVEKGRDEEADNLKTIMNDLRKDMGNLTVYASKVDASIRNFGKK